MTMEKCCIITGSFDPVTAGHIDLFVRAAAIFDEVFVVILTNGKKNSAGSGLFTYEERLEILQAAIEELREKGIGNVTAELYTGLTSDYAHEKGAKFIVRGARNASDFDYENSLAQIMRRFDPELETVILTSAPALSCVSSTYVRELLRYHCPIGDAIPPKTAIVVQNIYKRHG